MNTKQEGKINCFEFVICYDSQTFSQESHKQKKDANSANERLINTLNFQQTNIYRDELILLDVSRNVDRP